jgi:hypothetical protein
MSGPQRLGHVRRFLAEARIHFQASTGQSAIVPGMMIRRNATLLSFAASSIRPAPNAAKKKAKIVPTAAYIPAAASTILTVAS